jgi:hypothetical protein
MTIRYRLDDLGWFQFEQVIQSVLKAQFGFGIESWGGRGDFGRDAYYRGKLGYPSKDIQNEGAFVFQMKFVENANASGANPGPLLLKAVKTEIDNIKTRVDKGIWIKADFYIFITNALLPSVLRTTIENLFRENFPETRVYTHGGNDVCDWLDNNPQIRKAFPQLLSLRDLSGLLEGIINRHIHTQSRIAIEQAKEIAAVFVPTGPYQKALETLKKYNFVVLDGPPEVGKTAIAQMIVLTQVTDDWELIACKEPKEFIGLYKTENKQVFMVDDAFGRTEYDPSRGKLWEKDLPHVLRLINRKHWLILTSRKHILERAYKDMDLEDMAKDFPKPAEVLVDATKLTVPEKALMLYRQAKAENLLSLPKEIVKKYAEFIVYSQNFTPERIRSFVKERLPYLSNGFSKGLIDNTALQKEIDEAINNPTQRMKKTYDKLPSSHKWLLASLVSIDEGKAVYINQLERVYNNYCPSVDGWPPFGDVIDELMEAFIRVYKITSAEYVSWIHPSYRDLVVEEISHDISVSKRLLEFASIDIIKLALSDAGGTEGKRKLPLLSTKEQWDILKSKCLQIIDEITDKYSLTSLLAILRSSYSSASEQSIKDEIAWISTDLLEKLLLRWNERKEPLSFDLLSAFYELSVVIKKLLPSPDLDSTWKSSIREFQEGIRSWQEDRFIKYSCFKEWIDLISVINVNEPRFLRLCLFPDQYKAMIDSFIEFTEEQLSSDLDSSEAEEFNEFADELSDLAEMIVKFSNVLPSESAKLEALADELKSKAEGLKEEASELDPGEPDVDYEGEYSGGNVGDQFNVNRLFDDL